MRTVVEEKRLQTQFSQFLSIDFFQCHRLSRACGIYIQLNSASSSMYSISIEFYQKDYLKRYFVIKQVMILGS